MNFYKHHIGDYAQATSHLSFVEDAAYSRLIRKYYAEEKPLPADIKAVQRLVGARSKDERQAVEDVLHEFFDLQDDGWHNKRCDEELARANAQAETNRKIAEEREARKRAAKKAEINSTNRDGIEHESLHGSLNESLPSREPSQTPDTRHQTPDFKNITSPVITDGENHGDKNSQTEHPKTGSFPMYAEWLVGKTFASLCKTSGITEALLTDDILGEFKTYWLTQPQKMRTQTEWEHALIKSIKNARMRNSSKPPNSKTNRDRGRTMAARSIGFGVDDKQLPQRIEKEVTGEKLE